MMTRLRKLSGRTSRALIDLDQLVFSRSQVTFLTRSGMHCLMQPRSPGVFPVESCVVLSRRKTDDCLPEYGCTRHNCLCHYPGYLSGTYRRSRLGVAKEDALQYTQVKKNSGIIKEYQSLACCGGHGCGLAAEPAAAEPRCWPGHLPGSLLRLAGTVRQSPVTI